MAGRADGADGVVVLLPVKPRYADSLMRGTKRVEFRRRPFGRTPEWVVVYSSAPVQRVVGFFSVRAVEEDAPEALWRHHGPAGCITRDDFAAYFRDCERGVAIHVDDVTALDVPLRLADLGEQAQPPQSYKYLDGSVVARLRRQCAQS